MAKTESPIELELAEALKRLGISFTLQEQIGMYRVDFLVPAKDGRRIVIEADGREFHKDKNKDTKRQLEIEAQGYEVVRFTGSEIIKDSGKCAAVVAAKLECPNYIEVRVYETGKTERFAHANSKEALERIQAMKVTVEVG